jgi:hypothetical protein
MRLREFEQGERGPYTNIVADIKKAIARIAALEAEVERLTTNGIHTCHDQCQRPLCVAYREIVSLQKAREALEGELRQAQYLATMYPDLAQLSVSYRARADAAEARAERLRVALIEHNDALRSAHAVASREGKETNWVGLTNTIHNTLSAHHDTVVEARKALEDDKQ